MAVVKKKMKPRDELIMVGAMLIGALLAWYMILYKPVVAKTQNISESILVDQDSIAAIDKYKMMTRSLLAGTEQLVVEIEEWDKGFPPRKSLVSLAKDIIAFSHSQELLLVHMQPSLFELYALENSGNKVAGRFVQKQLFSIHLQGRYLDFGRMLEHIDRLPFNVTVTDVEITAIPEKSPLVDIKMTLFLYVHQ